MTDQAINISNDFDKRFELKQMPLSDMQDFVHRINVVNGWFETKRSFGDEMALLHSEVSEAFEAFRDHGLEDQTEIPTESNPFPKPEGIGSELADILIRLLDTCERYNIHIEQEFRRKMRYNATRGHRHGGKNV